MHEPSFDELLISAAVRHRWRELNRLRSSRHIPDIYAYFSSLERQGLIDIDDVPRTKEALQAYRRLSRLLTAAPLVLVCAIGVIEWQLEGLAIVASSLVAGGAGIGIYLALRRRQSASSRSHPDTPRNHNRDWPVP